MSGGGKRSRRNPDNKALHSNIKRPKHAEVNFLLSFPKGHYPSRLEHLSQAVTDNSDVLPTSEAAHEPALCMQCEVK